jgi:hypothetical protein
MELFPLILAVEFVFLLALYPRLLEGALDLDLDLRLGLEFEFEFLLTEGDLDLLELEII